LDAFNAHDIDAVMSFFADDCYRLENGIQTTSGPHTPPPRPAATLPGAEAAGDATSAARTGRSRACRSAICPMRRIAVPDCSLMSESKKCSGAVGAPSRCGRPGASSRLGRQ